MSTNGDVTQPAYSSSCPPNFVGKPHLASNPQTSLQAPCTRLLRETDRGAPVVLSGTRELGDRSPSRSPSAHVDSPVHAPRDMYSCEPRPEHEEGRSSRAPLFPHESRGKVTNEEKNYPKPTVITERVLLRLEHAVSFSDSVPPPAIIPTVSCGKEQFLHRN
jgi:hypothetical protein